MMKKLRIAFFFTLLFTFLSLPLCFAQAETIHIYHDLGATPLSFPEGASPFITPQGRTMLPLSLCDDVLQGNVTYTAEGDTITLTQTGIEYTTTLRLQLDSYTMYVDDRSVELDTAPLLLDGQIYIPLRAVAEALEHGVYWQSYLEGYNEIQVSYTAAELYIWSAEETYSEGALRYAVLQGTLKEKPLEEIYSREMSDFNDVVSALSDIPSGDLIINPMYHVVGYKIPQEKIREIETFYYEKLRANNSGYVGTTETCLDEIPPIIQDAESDFTNAWFSRQLYALGEGALYDSNREVYRFTYIPSFHSPYTIRVEIGDDGRGKLFFSMCDGSIAYYGGDIIRTAEKELTIEETEALLSQIEAADFWNLPVEGGDMGFDGSEWVFEGVKNGSYHFLYRWSPEGGAIRDLGMKFIELSREVLDNPY